MRYLKSMVLTALLAVSIVSVGGCKKKAAPTAPSNAPAPTAPSNAPSAAPGNAPSNAPAPTGTTNAPANQ